MSQLSLEEKFIPNKIEIYLVLKCGKNYYTHDRTWDSDYKYGWDMDEKEAFKFHSKDQIINLINKQLQDEHQRTFTLGDIYKIKEVIKIVEE